MVSQLAVLAALASSGLAADSALTDGCSTRSFTLPSWLIQDYITTGSRTQFRVLNRATYVSANLICQTTTETASGETISCTTSTASDTDPGLVVSLQPVNSTTSQVFLNQTWTCNDVKPYV